jgi:hypothetical protein
MNAGENPVFWNPSVSAQVLFTKDKSTLKIFSQTSKRPSTVKTARLVYQLNMQQRHFHV